MFSNTIKKIFNKFNYKYLFLGILNTLFGYWFGILCFFSLYDLVGVLGVGIIANFFSISFTFLTYKYFLFKTKGNFLKEYFKSIINYSFLGILSVILLWVFIEKVMLNIYFSQLIILPIIVLFGYFGNKFFVFNNFNSK